MEGPEAALLMVSVLMMAWMLVPWLDRKARREQDSPGFSDFGVAAILYILFLTLKAWDIGGGAAHGEEPDMRAVARVCAWITLGMATLITVLRFVTYKHRFFLFSGGIALHVALHGIFGMSYLRGLLTASVVVGLLLIVSALRGSRDTSGERRAR